MNDQLPPEIMKAHQNTMLAEQGVIGAILLDNNLMNEIDLTADQFWLTDCGMIFDSMQTLHAQRKPIDIVTVSDWLSNTRNVDYFADISTYAHKTPSAANGKTYAEKVKEYWRSREACRIASDLMGIKGDNKQDRIDQAISQLMSLNVTTKNHNHAIAQVLDAGLKQIQDAFAAEDGCLGLRTGIPELDEVTGGLHKTDLIVIGARPAMGKTALMLNMLTRHGDMRPGIMSSEQGHNQIGMRLISIHGNVNGARMRKGDLEDVEFTNITNAVSKLNGRNIWVNDKPGMMITDIERQARQWVHENNVNIIGVDYLQKIKHPNERLSKLDQIADIAIRLKDLAKELNVPVVALAQVKRDVDNRSDKTPGMSDIKDCGVIEQEADLIMTLCREEVYNPGQRPGVADVSFCKNRHGPTGDIHVLWVAKYMQFNGKPQYKGESA